ncbi:WbqC family protein [Echinicola jeungdonensis]|uniref:WbqC family protein n=1 Tax=Echinicola jeungdonensis TaxID=709343 RepID=A0ABV5J1B6_9BACT|nr:WbqC family protein [Echinicola jeungdonensis]MDN3668455.1 WbqC family protein [Echinicola jeungdonensis]
MEKSIVVDLFYLPPIEFFTAIQDYDRILVERSDNYQKQTYRNRAQIRLANKVETLSIPVYGGNKKKKYSQIKIDYDQKWTNVHLRGIQSAYGKAPFFEHFFPYLEDVYKKKIDNLYDFNLELLTLCLALLRMNIEVTETSQYREYGQETDLRGVIKTKETYSERAIYQPNPYMQLFGSDFVPNLSVIDLLFCEGPHSLRILQNSRKIE